MLLEYSKPMLKRSCLRLLSLRHLLIGRLHFLQLVHILHPLGHSRVLVQTQPGETMLVDPRVKVEVYGAGSVTRQNPLTAMLQLALQYFEATVRLCLVTLQRIVVLLCMVVAEPVDLSHKWPKSGDQEEVPLLKVDNGLFVVATRTKLVLLVVDAKNVVHHGTGLPANDAVVRVLEGRHTAILVDLQELLALHAIGGVAKLPKLHLVRYAQRFKDTCDLVRVWPC